MYLSHVQLPYNELVIEHGTELVVRDLALRYLAPAKLGDEVEISVRIEPSDSKVRIPISSTMVRTKDGTTCATALVTLVPVDAANGRVRRDLPEPLVELVREAVEDAVTEA